MATRYIKKFQFVFNMRKIINRAFLWSSIKNYLLFDIPGQKQVTDNPLLSKKVRSDAPLWKQSCFMFPVKQNCKGEKKQTVI